MGGAGKASERRQPLGSELRAQEQPRSRTSRLGLGEEVVWSTRYP